jgi:hypothetical protein
MQNYIDITPGKHLLQLRSDPSFDFEHEKTPKLETKLGETVCLLFPPADDSDIFYSK